MPVEVRELDIDEVLRYMGCPPERAEASVRVLAERAVELLLREIQPRWAWRAFRLTLEPDGVRLDGGLLLPGADLKAHLTGCKQAALFCATLGAGADRLIRRLENRDLAQAFAVDSAAAAAVESVCDQVELELQSRFAGHFFPFRYSPGYGDLPLSLQNELLDLLDAPRRVGLTASADHILIPRKSVTAFLGVADRPVARKSRSCFGCPAREECQYRKSGGHCGIS